MHYASREGVEFRAVAVMAYDDEIIPLQERIESVADDQISRKSTTPSVTCFTSLYARA